MTGTTVVWTEDLLRYDLGDHPLDPVRVELTMALARWLGVLDRPGVRLVEPKPADDGRLRTVHTAEYIETVKVAGRGHGLHTPGHPGVPHMHHASALGARAALA